MLEKVKVIISDSHLSAGRFYAGKMNPHEDFIYDNEMIEFFDYFSTGAYGDGPHGPVEVELILNGDFFDFLNIPYLGEFEEAITEEIALAKVEAALAGHPQVMTALKRFASKPQKSIQYLIGNHDAELFFEKVREKIIRAWDPEGSYPSEKVKIIVDSDRIYYESIGLEVRHGNQFEASNQLDFAQPLIRLSNGISILNIPWGSIYILKIINRLKWERSSLDKIRPVKVFVFFGLLFDPWFTLRFVFLSTFYFFKTRLYSKSEKLFGLKNTFNIFRQEAKVFQDLEKEARGLLESSKGTQTVIFGHTHRPMHRVYTSGKQYVNSGTWTKMVNLDWRFLGDPVRNTFVLIRVQDQKIETELFEWVGKRGPYRSYQA